LLDRRKERVEIGMQDRGIAMHERMFAEVSRNANRRAAAEPPMFLAGSGESAV
jgi:hypothetical protein